jgi:hypothetical protein
MTSLRDLLGAFGRAFRRWFTRGGAARDRSVPQRVDRRREKLFPMF